MRITCNDGNGVDFNRVVVGEHRGASAERLNEASKYSTSLYSSLNEAHQFSVVISDPHGSAVFG